MERIKNLDGYRKLILVVLIIMLVGFTVKYVITTSQVGYEYRGTILVHSSENGNDVYAGEIQGKPARFTVSPDHVVTFTCDSKTYGPYTVKEDSSAIPVGKHCTRGIEIREGDKIFFRGGYYDQNGMRSLYNQDGTAVSGITITTAGGGIVTDADGNIIDTMEPSPYTILSMAEGPTLTHRGSWVAWFLCAILVVAEIISVLFADELFRWRLSFHVQDADMAEPTDWEVARRYIGWGVSIILILILYVRGLK